MAGYPNADVVSTRTYGMAGCRAEQGKGPFTHQQQMTTPRRVSYVLRLSRREWRNNQIGYFIHRGVTPSREGQDVTPVFFSLRSTLSSFSFLS